jgi:hypothetical protein
MLVRAAAAGALLAAVVLPDRIARDGPVLCLFRRVTGRPCPSCGLTRSWQAIGHGRIDDGVTAHPFGLLTMLAAIWLASDGSAARRLGDADRLWGHAAAAAWIGAWMWRLSRER